MIFSMIEPIAPTAAGKTSTFWAFHKYLISLFSSGHLFSFFFSYCFVSCWGYVNDQAFIIFFLKQYLVPLLQYLDHIGWSYPTVSWQRDPISMNLLVELHPSSSISCSFYLLSLFHLFSTQATQHSITISQLLMYLYPRFHCFHLMLFLTHNSVSTYILLEISFSFLSPEPYHIPGYRGIEIHHHQFL